MRQILSASDYSAGLLMKRIMITKTSIRKDLRKNVAQSVLNAHLSEPMYLYIWPPNRSLRSTKKLRVQIKRQMAIIRFNTTLQEYWKSSMASL